MFTSRVTTDIEDEHERKWPQTLPDSSNLLQITPGAKSIQTSCLSHPPAHDFLPKPSPTEEEGEKQKSLKSSSDGSNMALMLIPTSFWPSSGCCCLARSPLGMWHSLHGDGRSRDTWATAHLSQQGPRTDMSSTYNTRVVCLLHICIIPVKYL